MMQACDEGRDNGTVCHAGLANFVYAGIFSQDGRLWRYLRKSLVGSEAGSLIFC